MDTALGEGSESRKREEVARVSIRAHHTRCSLVIFQCQPRWRELSSMRMDRKYLAIFAASTAAMNALSELAATVGCSFDFNAIVPPTRQKYRLVTDRHTQVGGIQRDDVAHTSSGNSGTTSPTQAPGTQVVYCRQTGS